MELAFYNMSMELAFSNNTLQKKKKSYDSEADAKY